MPSCKKKKTLTLLSIAAAHRGLHCSVKVVKMKVNQGIAFTFGSPYKGFHSKAQHLLNMAISLRKVFPVGGVSNYVRLAKCDTVL